MMVDPAENPPASKSSPLLEPEEKGLGDYLVPGLLGVAGAALLYSSMSKKKKSSESTKPEADRNEVKFSKTYDSFDVGDDWIEMTLEPYLAEQSEEGNLATADYVGTMENLTLEALRPLMADTRQRVISAFSATHKVSTADGETLISHLPDKPGVEKFEEWLYEQVEKFQEEY